MSQLTDAQLIAEATVIKTETALGANTADRVGTMFVDSIENKINTDVIDTNIALGTSDAKIPSQNAVKTYADALVVGLVDDRGNFTPSATSPGLFPTLNGSGPGNTIKKGDLWFIDTAGYLYFTPVAIGASVRALTDNPGQDPLKWNMINNGLGFTAENRANKSTDITLGGATPSDILYPSQKAAKSYIDTNTVNKTANNTITGSNSFSGTNSFLGATTMNGLLALYSFDLGLGTITPMNVNGDPGTSGQVLTSQGGAATPAWTTPTPGISLADDNTFTGDNTFTQSTEFTAGIVSPVGGTAQFDGTVDINGFFRVAGQQGTAGQVLKQGASGIPAWGDAGVFPYKVYTVLLNNTFADGFTRYVLQDTITVTGTTLSWIDFGNGIYNLISTGSSPFIINKTWIVIGQVGNFVSYLTSLTPNNVYIKTPSGQYFQNLSIEIRIYPS